VLADPVTPPSAPALLPGHCGPLLADTALGSSRGLPPARAIPCRTPPRVATILVTGAHKAGDDRHGAAHDDLDNEHRTGPTAPDPAVRDRVGRPPERRGDLDVSAKTADQQVSSTSFLSSSTR